MAAGPSAAELHAAAAAAAQRGHLRRQHQRLRQGQRLDTGAADLSGVDGWKAAVESGLYPLVICYIAIENGPFIDGLPIKNGDSPWLC